jgi:hypothetical protein
MRCPDCSKFVSMDNDEPDLEEISIEGATVSANVRLQRNCAECGTTLKSGSLEMEDDLDGNENLVEHLPCTECGVVGKASPGCANKDFDHETGHELSVADINVEGTEEGGGRYAKSYFGAEVTYEVTCSCTRKSVHEGVLSGRMAASEMDEEV